MSTSVTMTLTVGTFASKPGGGWFWAYAPLSGLEPYDNLLGKQGGSHWPTCARRLLPQVPVDLVRSEPVHPQPPLKLRCQPAPCRRTPPGLGVAGGQSPLHDPSMGGWVGKPTPESPTQEPQAHPSQARLPSAQATQRPPCHQPLSPHPLDPLSCSHERHDTPAPVSLAGQPGPRRKSDSFPRKNLSPALYKT